MLTLGSNPPPLLERVSILYFFYPFLMRFREAQWTVKLAEANQNPLGSLIEVSRQNCSSVTSENLPADK